LVFGVNGPEMWLVKKNKKTLALALVPSP